MDFLQDLCYDDAMIQQGGMEMGKVTWGVLGTAHIAKGHTIPGMLQAENCRLYAIAGRNLEKAKAFQEMFGFEKAYGSYEQLLADPEIEAVYIPLPNELHYEWAARALRAKKHVLCEKPLAPTVQQMQKLAETAKENGVILMEAFAYLHSPFMAAVKAELEAGTIGDVLYMESEFLTSDYDVSNIRMRKETYGGSVYDLGCYCTSQILWMLGQEPDKIQAVADFSDRGIDTCCTALLTFPGGQKATMVSGMCLTREPFDRIDRFRIHGTKGCIWSNERFNAAGELTYTIELGGEKTVKAVSTPDNYALEVEQLGRCITDGETPWVSPAFTAANGRVLERILRQIQY